jgi:hypothetical protein
VVHILDASAGQVTAHCAVNLACVNIRASEPPRHQRKDQPEKSRKYFRAAIHGPKAQIDFHLPLGPICNYLKRGIEGDGLPAPHDRSRRAVFLHRF